ncbi:hypothetical protein LRR18_08720 [Mangrovimonas sp. AS39]|uniref:hypothetical protein n=1 Tax=Mangrovimonas futianensis TaxID=2895523 RepID=UPI001E4D7F55|nr:hypothetical protein [Mangrovimonas futianensis]MCF1191665.1 hypothetical protein [Mangrovimonas futianensis]MCF1195447.1 hypothetical protein [Mangrovimonas futianensis]
MKRKVITAIFAGLIFGAFMICETLYIRKEEISFGSLLFQVAFFIGGLILVDSIQSKKRRSKSNE